MQRNRVSERVRGYHIILEPHESHASARLVSCEGQVQHDIHGASTDVLLMTSLFTYCAT